jgi:uncharacterized membrane protein YcaP (DUF421 family)
MNLDWGETFQLTMPALELIVRGTVVYWFLFGIFRFVLRRDASSVGITDFLFVVLLGDAAQNAMIGQGTSVADGLVLIVTLVCWNVLLDYLSYRFPLIERLAMGKKLCLFRDGQLQRRHMRREFITTEELAAKLREAGHEDFSDVKAIYLEANGEISVIDKK